MWGQLCLLLGLLAIVRSDYKYQTKWFRVPLDHFGYQRNETFQIKYLENEDYWDKANGPIFFYTGNEGQIEVFAQHTGFMWDIAEEFHAKLVFAEHRYYGASMPFGNKSLDSEHIGYLTSSQALADYADLVNYLQGNAVRPQYPVIAFGGSYGGMLAAYFRIKYPHLVTGAIAASAPVHQFTGMVPCEVYNRIVTSSFKVASAKCVENIKSSWSILRNFTASPENAAWLQKNWNLCDKVSNSSDLQTLFEFLQDMYGTLAMVNYPFESDFLMPLPAQPVRVVCQYVNDTFKDVKGLLTGIGKVLDVYANYKKTNKCINYKGPSYGNLDAAGWDYQSCTEMVMPMCTTGVDDMFEKSPWNFTEFSEYCHRKYNVYPKEEAARIAYGGNRLQAASNIVLSNGLLDPWAGGGVLNSVSDTVLAVLILDGAHHLDLMPKNPQDPGTVIEARNVHKQNIRKWIQEYRK